MANMEEAFSFGSFSLSPAARVLRKDGRIVPLGSRAFDLLLVMLERSGTLVTAEELMAVAWPEVVVVESNVRVQVAHLRRTLGCGRDGARYITNVTGRGYCFVEPVKRIDADAFATLDDITDIERLRKAALLLRENNQKLVQLLAQLKGELCMLKGSDPAHDHE